MTLSPPVSNHNMVDTMDVTNLTSFSYLFLLTVTKPIINLNQPKDVNIPNPHGSSNTNKSITIPTNIEKRKATVMHLISSPMKCPADDSIVSTTNTATLSSLLIPGMVFAMSPFLLQMLSGCKSTGSADGRLCKAFRRTMAFTPLTIVLETIAFLAIAIYVEDRGAQFTGFRLFDDRAEGFVPIGHFRWFLLLFFWFFAFFLFLGFCGF